MYFFYVDESGNPSGHHDPLIDGETPIFAITAVALHASHWRQFTKEFSSLKLQFFKNEIGQRRAEYYEVKGNSLLKPRNRTSRRRAAFTHKTFDLIKSYGGKVFSVVFVKNHQNPAPKISLYTHGLQILCERFHTFLEENGDPSIQGLLIIDSRIKHLDQQVAESHLSFVFGHEEGRQYTKLVEAPVFVNSKLSTGVQLADIMGSVIYSCCYHESCSTLANALDYSHANRYKTRFEEVKFSSKNRYNGYFMSGIRIITHSQSHDTPA